MGLCIKISLLWVNLVTNFFIKNILSNIKLLRVISNFLKRDISKVRMKNSKARIKIQQSAIDQFMISQEFD